MVFIAIEVRKAADRLKSHYYILRPAGYVWSQIRAD